MNTVVDVLMDRISLILFMVTIVNRLVEWFIKPILAELHVEGMRETVALQASSAVFGVVVSLVFRLNIFVGFGLGIADPMQYWGAIVLTGLLFAGGSTLLADLLKGRPTPDDWDGQAEPRPEGWQT